MPATATVDIRKEVKKFIDTADDKTVKMIYAMLEVEHMEDKWSDDVFIGEMDRRAKEFENGLAITFTIEEMEMNARAAFNGQSK